MVAQTVYFSVLDRPIAVPRVTRRRVKAPAPKDGCFYCSCAMYARGSDGALEHPDQVASNDHYIPFAITTGSGIPESRFVVACVRCNSIKANYPADVFQYYVRQTNMRQPTRALRADFNRFIFLLISAGFAAALNDAKSHADIVIPSFLSPRDTRGRYTVKDLRKA